MCGQLPPPVKCMRWGFERIMMPGIRCLRLFLLTIIAAIPLIMLSGCTGRPEPEGPDQEREATGTGTPAVRMENPAEWQAHAESVGFLYDTSTEAFYRSYGRLPSSLQELEDSELTWFIPIAPDFAPDFEVVDRPLGAIRDDLYRVQFSFTDTGYEFAFFSAASEDEQPVLVDLGDDQAASRYEAHFARYDEILYPWSGKTPELTRYFLAYSFSRYLVKRAYEKLGKFPYAAEEVTIDSWEPKEDVFNELPVIDVGWPGWFYAGFVPTETGGIVHIELVHRNRMRAIPEFTYTMDENGTVIETEEDILNQKMTNIEDSTTLVDTSLPGWGFPRLH